MRGNKADEETRPFYLLIQDIPVCLFDLLIDLFDFLLHVTGDTGRLWDELDQVACLAQ